MRRKCTGAKPITEAMELQFTVIGRGASYLGRSTTGRTCGPDTRENAGMSSESEVRIFAVESPRFPEEGSSSQGKSGPKPRTKVVGDGQQVDIPVPPMGV